MDHLEHIEQSVTIIPNLRAKEARRKSMANYAFPELHPEVKLEEPSKNLLIFTQTGVDSAGRRHSVSIPLLPLSGSKTRPSPSQEKPLVTIQRKGSHHGQHRRNSSRNMESINVSTDLDCVFFSSYFIYRSPPEGVTGAFQRVMRRSAWTV